MTVVVYEILDSMSGSVQKEQGQSIVKEVRRRYVIGQCESFNDCVTKITDYAPMYASDNQSYWVRGNLSVNGIGNKYFDVTATYKTLLPIEQQGGSQTDPVPGAIGWDTTGHTEHITQALSQESIPAQGAPDFEGAINVSGDSVQGIDIVRPCMRYYETWILPVATALDCNFIDSVYRLTGTVNLDDFRCWDPGEVLFMGARGQWQEDQPYVPVTFEFEVRPNEQNYYPWEGAGGNFVLKKGWEHIWILYEDKVDANRLVKHPIAAYKSKVYPEKTWDGILIGDYTIGQLVTGQVFNPALTGGGQF